ncbi:unnamed protein product [Gongylonema pulchrum]|uniref:Uncharacterized protein n=1 Tax=Gongylonema pulchrum TaxID=637853 RepID=A0A183D8Y9_9BILA|nr:unnamed protein product [Gongylonema pulchrum]
MYANKYNEKPRDITKFAPGCEATTEFCDLNAFIKRSRQLFFDDVDYQCTTNVTNLNLRKFFEFLFLRNHWMEHEEWLWDKLRGFLKSSKGNGTAGKSSIKS